MTREELQKKVNELGGQLRGKIDEFHKAGDEWKDAEQRAAYEKVSADYNEARAALEKANSVYEVEQRLNEVDKFETESRNRTIPGREDTSPPGTGDQRLAGGVSEEERTIAFGALFRALRGKFVTDKERELLTRCRLSHEMEFASPSREQYRAWQREHRRLPSDGSILDIQLSAHEVRALATTSSAAGGALVPSTLVKALEINQLAFGGIRQVADFMTTSGEGAMTWPTANDTSNEGTQVAENASIGTPTDPTFGKLTLNAFKFSSKPILVPAELLEDSGIDLPAAIGAMMGERLGRITNRKFTLGTGTNESTGLVTAAPIGYSTGALKITFDDVIRLEHSVDPAYRLGAGYMCHDSILLALRLLKDKNDQYLWQNGLRVGEPDLLHGKPLTINQHMADATIDGADVLLFGRLNAYKIRRVREIRMYFLNELYRANDQTGFVAFVREDGGLLNAGTPPVKKLRITAPA